jgi:hypothetical protein
LRRPLKAVALIATVAWSLWWVATGSGVLVPRGLGPSELLETRGVVVDAAVTHSREAVELEGGVTYVDHWGFAFTDTSGVAKQLSVQRDASDAYLWIAYQDFDGHALTRRVRAACGGSWLHEVWPLENMQASCTLDGVRLRYYPLDPSLFDLPDFKQPHSAGAPLRAWTEAGVVATVLSALVLTLIVLTVRVFRLFLG